MMQVVLNLDLHDERDKQRALKRVTGITGVDSVSMDMKEKKLTVTGDFDPVKVVSKLRKLFHTDIVTVGEPKKPEAKKETEEGGKDKKNPEPVQIPYNYNYSVYNPHPNGYYHYYGPVLIPVNDDNPNACVICNIFER